MGGPSQRSVSYPIMAAGWLFADLLLVLFLVGWGTEPTVPPPTPIVLPSPSPTTPKPSPTSTPSPTPTPTPTETSAPGLAKTPVTLELRITLSGSQLADPSAVAASIATEVAALERDSEQAGMVLIWGYAHDVGLGMRLAASVGEILPVADAVTFGDSTIRSFWKGGNAGQIDLEIYFLTT